MLNILPSLRQSAAPGASGVNVTYRGQVQLTYTASDFNTAFSLPDILGTLGSDSYVVLCTNREIFDILLDGQEPYRWVESILSAAVTSNIIVFEAPADSTPSLVVELPSAVTTTLEVAVYTVDGGGFPLAMYSSNATANATSVATTQPSITDAATITCLAATTAGTTVAWTNNTEDLEVNSSTGRLSTASKESQTFAATETITATLGSSQNCAISHVQFLPYEAMHWANIPADLFELVYTAQSSRSASLTIVNHDDFSQTVYAVVMAEVDTAISSITLAGVAGTPAVLSNVNTTATPDLRLHVYYWTGFDVPPTGPANLTVTFGSNQTTRVIALAFMVRHALQTFSSATATPNSATASASININEDGDVVMAFAVHATSTNSATWSSTGLLMEEILDVAVATTSGYRATAAVCRGAPASVAKAVQALFTGSAQGAISVMSIENAN